MTEGSCIFHKRCLTSLSIALARGSQEPHPCGIMDESVKCPATTLATNGPCENWGSGQPAPSNGTSPPAPNHSSRVGGGEFRKKRPYSTRQLIPNERRLSATTKSLGNCLLVDRTSPGGVENIYLQQSLYSLGETSSIYSHARFFSKILLLSSGLTK